MTSALAAGLGLALASALALDVGFLIQQGAAARARELSLRRPLASAQALFANARWLTGFCLGLAGWGLYFAALTLAPLSLVQTVAAGGIGLLVVLVAVGRRALPPRRERIGAVLATLGLMALAASIGHSTAVGSAPSAAGLVALAAAALVVVGMCAARTLGGARRSRSRHLLRRRRRHEQVAPARRSPTTPRSPRCSPRRFSTPPRARTASASWSSSGRSSTAARSPRSAR